ncbi:MAG: hypothetical protein J7K72_00510 [Candidatus Aenigmarchaeota archaeon]|nr:hypothetical protein [Candidatus Aenigmarchaeota archaeon]
MKNVQRGYGFEIVSMGMTDDYIEVLKERSNMIRVDRGIFENVCPRM